MIKILHCADLHLDSPFASDGIDHAQVRRNELRGAFSSLITYVKMSHIDLLLIAGDMFDREFVTIDTMNFVAREFASIPDCKIVISPGNHDPYSENSPWQRTSFPENVHIFTSEALAFFSFEELGCEVYGYAFTSPGLDHFPAAARKPRRYDTINILLAHADMTSPYSTSAPINEADIEQSGFDYVALGHIHNSSGIRQAGNTYYAYSGCLEGRDFGECGYKGAIIGTLDKKSGILSADLAGKRFSRRRFAAEQLDLTGCTDRETLVTSLLKCITDHHYGEDTQLRITLEGAVSPTLPIRTAPLAEALRENTHLFSLELIDHTSPLFDADALERDFSIRGAFFKELKPKLIDPDPQIRATAAAALRMGLAALSGAELGGDLSGEQKQSLIK